MLSLLAILFICNIIISWYNTTLFYFNKTLLSRNNIPICSFQYETKINIIKAVIPSVLGFSLYLSLTFGSNLSSIEVTSISLGAPVLSLLVLHCCLKSYEQDNSLLDNSAQKNLDVNSNTNYQSTDTSSHSRSGSLSGIFV